MAGSYEPKPGRCGRKKGKPRLCPDRACGREWYPSRLGPVCPDCGKGPGVTSYCTARPLKGRETCRAHGGLEPIGPASRRWGAGQGEAGARSRHYRPLSEYIAEARQDPQLMEIRRIAASLAGEGRQLLDLLEETPPIDAERPTRLLQRLEAARAAYNAGDARGLADVLQEATDLARSQADEAQAWWRWRELRGDLRKNLGEQRKAVEAENRREATLRLMAPMEQIIGLFQSLAVSLRENVDAMVAAGKLDEVAGKELVRGMVERVDQLSVQVH